MNFFSAGEKAESGPQEFNTAYTYFFESACLVIKTGWRRCTTQLMIYKLYPSSMKRVVNSVSHAQCRSFLSFTKSSPILLLAVVVMISGKSYGQSFMDATATQFQNLPGFAMGATAWGDYDNDGRLDLMVTGSTDLGMKSILYQNTPAGFVDQSALFTNLPNVQFGSVAWGDYDNDGRLDLMLTGADISGFVSKLYRNTPGGFVDESAALPDLPGLAFGTIDWVDYDNDGRLDLLLTGLGLPLEVNKLYHNTPTGFVDVFSSLPTLTALQYTSTAWGDINNDGRKDLLITGNTNTTGPFSKLFLNEAAGFLEVTGLLPGLYVASVAWGDYDNDGRLDLIATGQTEDAGGFTALYHNTPGGFVDVTNTLIPEVTGQAYTKALWGDYNNDGRSDLFLAGSGASVSVLYGNEITGFVNKPELPSYLATLTDFIPSWVDFNNDGKLDLFTVGGLGGFGQDSKLYSNQAVLANTSPEAPVGLSAAVTDVSAKLTWLPALDIQTLPEGLNYNLYVSDTPGGQNIVGPMADQGNGFRKIVKAGGQQTLVADLAGLIPDKTYYWSVQAIDPAFSGSPFSEEQSFKTLSTLPVTLISFTAENTESQVALKWKTTTEINSSFFEIQRSKNAKDWAKIGEVSASGESSGVRDYSFQDEKPFSGNNYYRLKMIDKDQTYAFSGIRNVRFAGSPEISFYPNPVIGQLTIKTKGGESIKNIQIVNTSGQKVYYSELKTDDPISVGKFQNGLYAVKVTKEDGQVITHKIVINH